MAAMMASLLARAMSTLRFRINRSLSCKSRSSGSATTTFSVPSHVGQRQHRVFASNRLAEQLDHGGGNLDFAQVHVFQAMRLSQGLGHVVAAGMPQLDQARRRR